MHGGDKPRRSRRLAFERVVEKIRSARCQIPATPAVLISRIKPLSESSSGISHVQVSPRSQA
jgi:hypothetical protein